MMFTFQQTDQNDVNIYYDSRLLTTYHFDDENLKSFFHPVNTSQGHPLTLNAPYDHPWHHGLYFALKYINGVNFWEDHNAGPDEYGRTRTIGKVDVNIETGKCTIHQNLNWEVLSSGFVFMDEQRLVTIKQPDETGAYRIDFDMTFHVKSEDLCLERTSPKEFEWGGYAGLSFRPVRSFAGGKVMNAEHIKGVTAAHGTASKWCDYSGCLDGGVGLTAGAAIFNHPGNERYPTPFYVFDSGNLQFLQSALLFHEPLTLGQGETLRLRYGVYIHNNVLSKDHLEKAYQEYLNT